MLVSKKFLQFEESKYAYREKHKTKEAATSTTHLMTIIKTTRYAG